MIAAPYCYAHQFGRAELTPKGTRMGCQYFFLAKICRQQPTQPANTGTAHQQCTMPLNSKYEVIKNRYSIFNDRLFAQCVGCLRYVAALGGMHHSGRGAAAAAMVGVQFFYLASA
jgi:hypothetical protein